MRRSTPPVIKINNMFDLNSSGARSIVSFIQRERERHEWSWKHSSPFKKRFFILRCDSVCHTTYHHIRKWVHFQPNSDHSLRLCYKGKQISSLQWVGKESREREIKFVNLSREQCNCQGVSQRCWVRHIEYDFDQYRLQTQPHLQTYNGYTGREKIRSLVLSHYVYQNSYNGESDKIICQKTWQQRIEHTLFQRDLHSDLQKPKVVQLMWNSERINFK